MSAHDPGPATDLPAGGPWHFHYDPDADVERHPVREELLDVAADLIRLVVVSFGLGVLALGPLVAVRLVRRVLR